MNHEPAIDPKILTAASVQAAEDRVIQQLQSANLASLYTPAQIDARARERVDRQFAPIKARLRAACPFTFTITFEG